MNIEGEDAILKEIVADERSYKEGLVHDLGKTAWNKKLFPTQKFDKLQSLITKLDEFKLLEMD